MSLRRWAGTTVAMCAVAGALRALGAAPAELQTAVGDPQGVVDRLGADALVLVVVTALAWLCWAWGALGLLLTAASTTPGRSGRLARSLLRGLLPRGARQAAALALGIGLSTAAPVVLPAAVPLVAVATADPGSDPAGPPSSVVVDWPAAPTGQAAPDRSGAPAPLDRAGPEVTPDWPGTAAGDHVVLRGDCLWDIAAAWLYGRPAGTSVSDADVQRAVQAWWQTNRAVIGPDPDLLLPGQVLRPPE
jgi:nucleoid-associated protein YgaU